MAKRQKFVYQTNQIAHLWAHKTQESARNPQGNFYFEDETIYSYGGHFPIARHVTYRGKNCVLMTTRSYSNTTAGHIWSVRRAIPDTVQQFAVYNPARDIQDVQREYRAAVSNALKRAENSKNERARVANWREYLCAVRTLREFCEFFGLKLRVQSPIQANRLNELLAIQDEKRQLAQEARDEKRAARYAAIDKARELERAKFMAELPALIEAWRAGTSDRIERYYYGEIPAVLRIAGDQIETSQGASFPLSHAIRVLPIVKQILDSGETFQANGRQIRLGHYSIDSIDSDGTLRAGCHTVKRDELLRLIDQLEERSIAGFEVVEKS